MTETIACARGCLRWGYHASDCEQSDPHTPGCIDEQCAGCNPERCGGEDEVYNRGARCRASDVRATEGPS